MRPADIVPGSVILADDNGAKTPVRIASLFRKHRAKKVRALGVRLTDEEVGRLGLEPIAIPGKISYEHLKVATDPSEVGSLEDLFVVVEFDPMESKTLTEAVERLQLSRDIRRNAFGPRRMRVRSLDAPWLFSKPKRQKKPFRSGFIFGDVLNQAVRAKTGRQVVVNRLAHARGFDQKALAGPGEGGTPVISSSGALVGFVVSGTESSALILPAEDLVERLNIDLLKPKDAYSQIRAVAGT